MDRIYSSKNGAGFQEVDVNTPYKYVTAQNIVKGGGSQKTERIFNFYVECIKNGNNSLIEAQDPELLISLCDRNGSKLIDYSFIYGNYDFVKFLVANCNSNVNDMPLKFGETTLNTFLNTVDPLTDDKLLSHAKIAGYLIKEGAFAYSCDAFSIKYEPSEADFEIVLNNMQNETVESVEEFIDKCVNALGKNINKDDELIDSIDVFIRLGFMPNINTMSTDNYKKYKINDLLILSERKIKLSNKLSYTMGEYSQIYLEKYFILLSSLVREANTLAGTYSLVEYDENGINKNIVDYSNKKYNYLENLDDCIIINADEDDEEEDEFDGEIYDEDLDDEVLDADDYCYKIPTQEELDSLTDSQKLSEDELQLDDGQELMIDRILDEDDIIPKYDFFELMEIANKNQKYILESSTLKSLFENEERFNRFKNICKSAEQARKLVKFMQSREDFIKANSAARNNDNVDDMLDILEDTYEDERSN